jgi:hypothetical protein
MTVFRSFSRHRLRRPALPVTGGRNGERVQLLDRAQIRPVVMSAVTKEVSAIFRHASVDVIWLTGDDRVDFLRLLVILDPDPSKHTPEPGNTIGVTVKAAGNADPVAYLFVNRIDRVSREAGRNMATVMAYVLAHELGHLLLPPGSHSKAGIMRARWDPKVLTEAAQGIYFTREQAAQIRARIAGQPAPVETPALR